MTLKSNKLIRRVQSIVMAAALAVSVVPAISMVATPITAQAYSSSVRDKLNDNERLIYDAYAALTDHVMGKDVKVTAANKADYSASNFYTIYTDNAEKKVINSSDRKYGRRAYIYDNPLDLSVSMTELKFVYIKTKSTGKYSCYAYLVRTSDNNFSNEEKQLKTAVNRIMKNIDDDGSAFARELAAYDEIYDSVTYSAVEIDKRDYRNTAYGALVLHRASTQGYALAFAALLDELDVSNNVLFSDKSVWNQVHVNSRWYDVSVSYSDSKASIAKRGIPTYTYFNVPQSTMDGLQKRVDFANNMPKSTGSEKSTEKQFNKYSTSVLEDKDNLTLAILNDDGTITRTDFTSGETTKNFVPIFTYGTEKTDISSLLTSCTVTPLSNPSSITVTKPWTTESPYITFTKAAGSAISAFKVDLLFDGSTTPVSFSMNLITNDNTTGKYIYKIVGDTATFVRPTNKSVKTVTIPDSVVIDGKEYPITKIDKNAFKKCKKLEVLVIGRNVKEIGANACTGKTKLIRVETEGALLTKVGNNAFKSSNSNTFYLLRAANSSKYNSLVKKIKKAGGKDSIFKFRNKLF